MSTSKMPWVTETNLFNRHCTTPKKLGCCLKCKWKLNAIICKSHKLTFYSHIFGSRTSRFCLRWGSSCSAVVFVSFLIHQMFGVGERSGLYGRSHQHTDSSTMNQCCCNRSSVLFKITLYCSLACRIEESMFSCNLFHCFLLYFSLF